MEVKRLASKKELLKMLHEAIALEKRFFVLDYSKYLELLEDDGIIKLLNTLIQDSWYHTLALGELINEVEERAY
ncbi:MAG: hypothetical protein QF673_02200 [Candidatus Hydrothermarchaeota archaeon]|jgi:rubrerythrin|nr:hypothetical protein [Candidatus Hydrothermarchaeota archaeon]